MSLRSRFVSAGLLALASSGAAAFEAESRLGRHGADTSFVVLGAPESSGMLRLDTLTPFDDAVAATRSPAGAPSSFDHGGTGPIGPSVIVRGRPAVQAPEAARPSRRGMAAPMVIRGGVVGSAAPQPAKAATPDPAPSPAGEPPAEAKQQPAKPPPSEEPDRGP